MAVPVYANVVPASGSVIGSTSLVSFEVTSTPALVRQMVFVRFEGAGVEEVAWDGTAFTSAYAAFSSRAAITNGFRFVLRRGPAWPGSPIVAAYAINASAEEATSLSSYVLERPAVAVVVTSPMATFPVGVPAYGSDAGFDAFDGSHFQRTADRALDPEYVAGLKAGEGYELIRAAAEVNARASAAVKNFGEGSLVGFARGGDFARGRVEFYRETATPTQLSVKAGTTLTSRGGRYFVTAKDAVFAGGVLGPVAVEVRSVFPDWQANVQGVRVADSGIVTPGEIDTIRVMIQVPSYADPLIRVRQIDDLAGGRSAELDLLAGERGVRRNPGEDDVSLAYRTRNLPDNISPNAFDRLVGSMLERYAIPYQLVETFEPTYGGCLDAPNDDTTYVYDDPRDPYPAHNRTMDWVEQWGTFYVVVGSYQPIEDYGGLYDDDALDADHLHSPISGGRRAVGAYDLSDSATFGDGSDLGMAYDGRDVAADALLNAVWDVLQSNRAAGIVAGLMQKGWL